MQIIKVGAMWCPSCIIMNKFWNRVESNHKDIEFINYDLDIDEDIVKEYNIGNILPVIIVIQNGCEIERLIGEKKESEIELFIQKIGESK